MIGEKQFFCWGAVFLLASGLYDNKKLTYERNYREYD